MSSNIREFTMGLRKFTSEVLPERCRRIQTALALEGMRSLVMMTPVDTGRLRGNWQLSHGSPAEGYTEDRFDKTGGDVLARAQAGAQAIAPYEFTWIHNGVPYAPYVNDGTETRAGVHMLETTADRLRRIARSAGVLG